MVDGRAKVRSIIAQIKGLGIILFNRDQLKLNKCFKVTSFKIAYGTLNLLNIIIEFCLVLFLFVDE